MKKILLLAAVTLLAASCKISFNGYTIENLTTDDVVYNAGAEKPWTFSASCYWSGTSAAAKIGVFYGNKPNVSFENYTYSAGEQYLSEGSNQASNSVNLTSVYGGFESGDTCYYRAYVTITSSTGVSYSYGEEKSFVVQ